MSDSICPGAIHQPGSCRFTVWAPRARRVTLRLVGPVHRDVPMLALPHGYFEAELTDVGPGQR
ncbi:MAG: hypothetical protein ACXWPK_19080, partial [Isosphaeraceae bacterium]